MIRPWPRSIFSSLGLMAWGAGSGHLLLATAFATALAAAAILPYRLSSSPRAISWFNDGSIALLAAGSLWQYLNAQGSPASLALSILSAAPILLYPKLLFSALQSSKSSAPASRDGAAVARRWLEETLSFSRAHLDRRKSLSFPSAYYFLCLFIAAVTLPSPASTIVFFAGALGYGAFNGWDPARAPARGAAVALAACALSLAAAWGGSGGIQKAQDEAQDYFSKSWAGRQDLYNGNTSQTAIGRRGSIENGGRLIARVDWPLSFGYLRSGLFSHTSNGLAWTARPRGAPSSSIPAFPSSGQFRVAPDPASKAEHPLEATLSLNIRRDRSIIPLPLGSTQFSLPSARVDITEMSLPLAVGISGFSTIHARFYPEYDPQPAAGPADLDVPLQLEGLIDRFVAEAGAHGLPPAAAAAAIRAHFARHWTYSLRLQSPDGSPRSFANFLGDDRAGHCEYFATISTLAMRRLGYPARYATGFMVRERNPSENLFWVRARDAHAWATFWNGKSWQTLDATPAGAGEELDWLDAASDEFSKLQYHLDSLDLSSVLGPRSSNALLALAAALALVLLAKARFSRKTPRFPANAQSELLTASLEALTGLARLPRESAPNFWIRAAELIPEREGSLRELASLRQQALFHPMEDPLSAMELTEARARRERRALPKRLPRHK